MDTRRIISASEAKHLACEGGTVEYDETGRPFVLVEECGGSTLRMAEEITELREALDGLMAAAHGVLVLLADAYVTLPSGPHAQLQAALNEAAKARTP